MDIPADIPGFMVEAPVTSYN